MEKKIFNIRARSFLSFWINTNFTSQWCLNVIVALEFTKNMMKPAKEDYEREDWVK